MIIKKNNSLRVDKVLEYNSLRNNSLDIRKRIEDNDSLIVCKWFRRLVRSL